MHIYIYTNTIFKGHSCDELHYKKITKFPR